MESVPSKSGSCSCGQHDILHQCWACERWFCRDCMPFADEACDTCFERVKEPDAGSS